VSYLALGIVGIVMQTRHTAQMNESMRAQWSEAGGRELRSH
jgi:hypothetical protein